MSPRGLAMRSSLLPAPVKGAAADAGLVEREGADAIFAKAALRSKPYRRSQRRPALREILGAHAYGAKFVVGAATPFGEIDQARFKALIERARMSNTQPNQ